MMVFIMRPAVKQAKLGIIFYHYYWGHTVWLCHLFSSFQVYPPVVIRLKIYNVGKKTDSANIGATDGQFGSFDSK